MWQPSPSAERPRRLGILVALAFLAAGLSPGASAQGDHTTVRILEGASVVDELTNRAGGFEYTVQAKFQFSRDQLAYFKLVPAPDATNAAYDNGTLSADKKRLLGGWGHRLFVLNETGGVLKYDADGRPVNGDLGYFIDTTPSAPMKLEGGRTYQFRAVVTVPDKAGSPQGQHIQARYHLVAADSKSRGGSGGSQDPAATVEALLILHGEGTAGPSRGITLDVTGPKDGVLTNDTVAGTGRARGAEVVELLLNGDLVGNLKLDAQGRFDFSAGLREGANTLQIVAKNRQGDKAQKSFQVFYQPVAGERALALPRWGGLGGSAAEVGLPWLVGAELLSAEPWTNVTLTAREYADRPGFIPKGFNGTAARYFGLAGRGLAADETAPRALTGEAARLQLRVPKAWLDQQGLAAADLFAMRWTGTAWERLEAAVVSEDAEHVYVAVETSALGEFALAGPAGGAKAAPKDPIAAPGAEGGPKDAAAGPGAPAPQQDLLVPVAAVALLGLAGAGAFVLRRRRSGRPSPGGTSALDGSGPGDFPGGPTPAAGGASSFLGAAVGAAAAPAGAVAAAPGSPGLEHLMTDLTSRLTQLQEGWQQDRETLSTMANRLESLDQQLLSMERELGQRMASPEAAPHRHILNSLAGSAALRNAPRSLGWDPRSPPGPSRAHQPAEPGAGAPPYMPPRHPRGGW